MTPDCLVLAAITTRRSFAGYSLAAEAMMTVKLHASTILAALAEVQSKLVGKAVVLTDGKAGTVENVWLDELHGLRISIKGHDGRWPISTIKLEQTVRGDSEPANGSDGG